MSVEGAIWAFAIMGSYWGIALAYGWRGVCIAVAPILLAFGLWAAHEVNWLTLFDAPSMLRFAMTWLVMAVLGSTPGILQRASEAKKNRS